jgi:hypothetical protein
MKAYQCQFGPRADHLYTFVCTNKELDVTEGDLVVTSARGNFCIVQVVREVDSSTLRDNIKYNKIVLILTD